MPSRLSGGLTNKATQTIAGTVKTTEAAAGSTVTLYDNGTKIGTATVGSTGSWSASVTLSGDGSHKLTAANTDAAGNTGTSAAVGYTLDTVAPTVAITSVGGLTNKATQTIAGTVKTTEAAAGSTVTLYDNGTKIGTATVGSTGSWSASVTLSGDGSHKLTASNTDAAGNTGTSSALSFTLAQTVKQFLANQAALDAGGAIVIADTAANVSAALDQVSVDAHVSSIILTDAGTPALTLTAVRALNDATALLKISSPYTIMISDTSAHIQALTAAQIASLGVQHVTKIAASDTGVSLTTAQAAALETAHIAVSAPSGSQVTLSDTAAHLEAMATGAIQGLPGVGVTALYSNNANAAFSVAQTSDIAAGNLTVSASGIYSVTERFSNGATVTVASNGSGGGTLNLGGASVTVTSGPSQLSVTAGTEILPLPDYSYETFAFAPHFGQDTINGFAASGTGHDTLQFSAAAFGETSTNSQAQDLTAMLTHTTQNGAGNAVIADIYGDAVTLAGVTKATLAAHAGDFKFT